MRIILIILFFNIFYFIFSFGSALAQEEKSSVPIQGGKYINFRIKALDKYNSRIEHQQQRLIHSLQKKEHRFAVKLKRRDSTAFAKYAGQGITYDSIEKLSPSDSSVNAVISKKKNSQIDSLQRIQTFMEDKAGAMANATKTSELEQLKKQLNYRSYVSELISKRMSALKGLAADGSQLPRLKGIEKQVFYGKAKMKVFKDINDNPSAAEDEALEYLQGSAGFDKYMNKGTGGNAMQAAGGGGANQLEQMGYQTKQQMQKGLEGKLGGNMGDVSKQMGGALQQWPEQQKKLGEVRQLKHSAKQIGNIEKPSFKVNPMRGLPFMKRIEKQYSWQTSRASDAQPALFDASAMIGFKHTPKLTYGLGAAWSEGLGQGWQKIHFSFQGIGYRTFAKLEWQYGIGAYTGYERMYKPAAFYKNNVQTEGISTHHNTSKYTESVLIGLTKSYNINAKYKGAIQVLYDVWWQQKELRSPIVLRFVTVKK